MERRSFVKGAGMAGILATGVAPAVHAQQAVRWRLTSSFPKSLDTLYGGAELFAKNVNAAAGGKLNVTVHQPGELVPAFGVVDAVQQGTVEAATTAAYYFFGKDDTFALDCAVPFGMNSRQMTAWYTWGNGRKLFREFYRQYDIVNFAFGNTGAQMGGWFRKEIKSAADLKGLKFRMGGFVGKVLEPLGVVPQNIPAGEVYQGLEKGTLDAVEFVNPYDDLKLGFYKVAKNYYYPGFWEGGPQITLYVNVKAWEALSPELQAIVESAAFASHVSVQAHYDTVNPIALKELIANGVKLHRFDKSILDAAYKSALQLYSDLSNKNPNWKKIWTDYEQFRNQSIAWFRFNEAGFNSYMESLKL
jgi:TRAP-type mannitol/chloroaromatic compound transport system substrate-binding protein